MAAYTKSQPLGRFGSVRDIADATVYLFSNTGSYVTGQTLVGKCLPRGSLGVGPCSNCLQWTAQTGACRPVVRPGPRVIPISC